MKTLYCLIDDVNYIKTNCYQHQMSEALESRFDVKYVTVDALRNANFPPDSHILSRLKIRTFARMMHDIKRATHGSQIMVYDQDPWESFFVEGSYSRIYEFIWQNLNVSTFLNISHWWRDRVIESGMRSRFVQIWTLPRYCRDKIVPWKDRKHDAVFCGTLYDRRKKFFDSLEEKGCKVEILQSGKSFSDYLEVIANSKVAIRSEWVDWKINSRNGTLTISSPNALWKRDIETAACGAFSIRDHDSEGDIWKIQDIPSIMTFETVDDAAKQLQKVLSMRNDEAESIIENSIEHIRNHRGWNHMCDVIEDVLNGNYCD